MYRTAGTVVTVTVGILLGWTAAYQLPGSQKADDAKSPSQPRPVGDTLTGELTSTSQLNANDGSRYVRLPVKFDADTFVRFELEGALGGTLTLFDDNDNLLAHSSAPARSAEPASDSPAVSLGAEIERTGTYWLAVSGVDSDSYGPFEVSSGTLDVRNGGDLATEDELTGFFTGDPNAYSLDVEKAGLYRVTMRSDVVDAYLRLAGQNVEVSDDDSGEGVTGRDAQLTTYLASGDYRVEASAYGDTTTGEYTLSVEPQPLPAGDALRNEGDVSPSDELTGYFNGDPRKYTLNVDDVATYTIDMRSETLDAYLVLTGEGVNLVDDDSGDGYDARLKGILQPGTYTLSASGYEAGTAGMFTLAVATSSADALSDEARRIEGVGRLEDALMSDGAKDYVWHIDEAGRYAVTMRSSELDAFLKLTGESGVALSDDDSGGGYDARIETNLTPGDYTINASGYEDGTGRFRLQTEKLD
ncbi:hypothetical protein [Salinicola halophilus]|uniref:hypothetical protein n=1 Tax=Salinicola halophilus TaxID=184065 RepID=UPI0013A6784B|nr:hypothetical protein [Salinicola halophilus]